jgi:hypothetical protein
VENVAGSRAREIRFYDNTYIGPVCAETSGQRGPRLNRLMYAGVLPKPRDLVLDVQFAPLQFHNFQTVRRRMGKRFADFLLERLVPSFEFRKMRLDRHLAASLRLVTPAPFKRDATQV